MSVRLPIRLRVAGAFALTTAVALAGLAAFVYYRVDATLTEHARTALTTQADALARVPAERRRRVVSSMSGRYFAQVLTTKGRNIATSTQVKGALLPADRVVPLPGERVRLSRRVMLAGEDEAEPSLLLVRRRRDFVLVVGTSFEDVEAALDGVRAQFLVGGPLALVLASGVGYLVAGFALRPVERMRRQAATISARRSDDRLPLPVARDEIRRLGETLNAMLDRLASGIRRERRFVAEASHELRTPLALLRMELDLALSGGRSSDELRAAVRSASEEVDRLTRLADDLLLLATSDEGRLRMRKDQVDLGDLLRAVAERFGPTAGAQGRAFRVNGAFPLVVRADRDHLYRAVSNVVDNALRHGGGDVELAAGAADGRVSIRVLDEGAGVPAGFAVDGGLAEGGRPFDRFARAPGARTAEGRGLGLAIVQAVVEEHEGTVSMGTADDGRTVVTIELVTKR